MDKPFLLVDDSDPPWTWKHTSWHMKVYVHSYTNYTFTHPVVEVAHGEVVYATGESELNTDVDYDPTVMRERFRERLGIDDYDSAAVHEPVRYGNEREEVISHMTLPSWSDKYCSLVLNAYDAAKEVIEEDVNPKKETDDEFYTNYLTAAVTKRLRVLARVFALSKNPKFGTFRAIYATIYGKKFPERFHKDSDLYKAFGARRSTFNNWKHLINSRLHFAHAILISDLHNVAHAN